MTGGGTNTYLILPDSDSRSDAALIDAGIGELRHVNAIDAALDRAEARLAEVLVTHTHSDHARGVGAIAQRHPAATLRKYPWREEDARFGVTWQPLADREFIDVGGATLMALHTPGHSPDHLAFWHEGSGTVFTGDLVIDGGSVMIQASRGGVLAQYLASLERVLALRPRRLLPGHGPEIEDPARVLTAYLEHRRFREQQVLAALQSGRDTVQAVAESIYDGLNPALMPAARETVRAHLEKLRSEGRATVDDDRWS
jgi:glyoxylase-like metal-dependent hydrolase (beta-lactamase superfamily II)